MERDEFLDTILFNDYLLSVFEYAKKCHEGQIRKYTNEPYFNHPLSVARILFDYTKDMHVLSAALLHDVVEDTEATIDDIEFHFGSKVAQLVSELTDVSKPEDGNRARRKAIDREHIANASPEGKMIKLADLIDNCDSIVKYGKGFAKTYLNEMYLLLSVLNDSNILLYGDALKVYSQAVSEVRK